MFLADEVPFSIQVGTDAIEKLVFRKSVEQKQVVKSVEYIVFHCFLVQKGPQKLEWQTGEALRRSDVRGLLCGKVVGANRPIWLQCYLGPVLNYRNEHVEKLRPLFQHRFPGASRSGAEVPARISET